MRRDSHPSLGPPPSPLLAGFLSQDGDKNTNITPSALKLGHQNKKLLYLESQSQVLLRVHTQTHTMNTSGCSLDSK